MLLNEECVEVEHLAGEAKDLDFDDFASRQNPHLVYKVFQVGSQMVLRHVKTAFDIQYVMYHGSIGS